MASVVPGSVVPVSVTGDFSARNSSADAIDTSTALIAQHSDKSEAEDFEFANHLIPFVVPPFSWKAGIAVVAEGGR